ncbi:hypothetical protein [Sodalis praecaptivus]|uniref:hypothetical protein n=1 Tax=Sodalis praecaptivus TaxID=1239307 RepID=UPI0011DC9411|nr:hypothetical protein [Sodalis praecaptivus]
MSCANGLHGISFRSTYKYYTLHYIGVINQSYLFNMADLHQAITFASSFAANPTNAMDLAFYDSVVAAIEQ